MISSLEITPGTNSSFYKKKNIILFLVKILIAFGLLAFLIGKINLQQIGNSISSANTFYILCAILLLPINIFLQYLKWEFTCIQILNENKKSKILNSLFYGLSAGAFTPGRIGEYFGRGLAFKEKPIFKVTIATALDKLFPLLVIIFFGLISSAIFANQKYEIGFVNIALIVFGTAAVAIILVLLFKKNRKHIYEKLLWFKKFHFIEKLFLQIKSLKGVNRFYSLQMISVSALFYCCFVFQFILLIAAFSNHFNFIPYLYSVSLILFVKIFIGQISIAELGVREGISIYFLSQIGVANQIAFSAALFIFLINILLPSLIGLIFIFKRSNA